MGQKSPVILAYLNFDLPEQLKSGSRTKNATYVSGFATCATSKPRSGDGEQPLPFYWAFYSFDMIIRFSPTRFGVWLSSFDGLKY